MKINPSYSEFEIKYSPINCWNAIATNPQKAYEAEVPSLFNIGKIYGEANMSSWINQQVTALFGSSNSRDVNIANSISLFCDTFVADAMSYKVTEIALFFARYKAGRYDNSYSSFDTKRIGNAFRFEFLPERRREIDQYVHEREAKEREAEYERRTKNAITYEEYLKRKEQNESNSK